MSYNENMVRTNFLGNYFTKFLSYFIFIFWTLLTISPLVWMGYASFKTNEELTISMYSLPHDMFFNKDDEYEVVQPQLNIVYPKKIIKKFGFEVSDYDIINEHLIIIESTSMAPGRRVKVAFLDRSEMSSEINALKNGDKIRVNELPKKYQRQIHWDTVFWNYTSAWVRGGLGGKFLNSIIYTFVSTFFVILFGLMIGYAVSKLKFKKLAALIVGLIGLGYLIDINQLIIPLFLMLSKIGLTDTHLGIILVYSAFGLPMAVLLTSQYIRGLPNSLIESAYIDGATAFKTFVAIIVPMTVPVIITISIMSGLGIWNEFLLVLVMASKEFTKSLPVGVYSFSSRTGTQLGWQIAALVIATLPIILVYFIFQKRLAEGVAGGALKE